MEEVQEEALLEGLEGLAEAGEEGDIVGEKASEEKEYGLASEIIGYTTS